MFQFAIYKPLLKRGGWEYYSSFRVTSAVILMQQSCLLDGQLPMTQGVSLALLPVKHRNEASVSQSESLLLSG